MIRSRQGFSFAKRGAAVMLAATLTAGMVPTMALAQGDGAGGTTATVAAAATGDGFYLEEGQAYTVPLAFSSDVSMVVSMATRYLGSSASVVYENGSYTVKITASSTAIETVTLAGKAAARTPVSDTQVEFTVSGVSTLAGAQAVSMSVGGAMGGQSFDFSVSFDTSSLPTQPPVVEPEPDPAPDPEPTPDPDPEPAPDNPGTDSDAGDQLEVGKTYTVPLSFADASGKPSMAGNMLNPNATVQVNEGSYTVTLVVKAGDAYEFRALTLGADKAPTTLTRDADGNYVFTGTLDSLEGAIEVGFTYYVAAMDREMTHSAFATFDTAGATEGATTPEPGEPSEPSEPGGDSGSDDTIVEGKEYPAAITWAKYGSMASRFMESEATIVYRNGTYTVKLPVTSTGAAAAGFALTYDGTKYAVTDGAFALAFKELPASIEVSLSSDNMPMVITDTITFDLSKVPAVDDGDDVVTADKTKLNEALAAAKALEQGSKTDDAWDALQSAIATAKKAAANANIPQQGIDGVTAQLNAAIETFKNSADKEAPSGQYGMVVGKTYTASVSYAGTGSFAGMNDMLQQMVTKYFGTAVELSLLEDGTYDVTVYFGGSTGYDEAIGDLTYNGQAVKQSANKTYTFNVPSLENAVNLALHVGGTMNMDITYAMTVDTSTIALKSGDTPVASVDKSTLQSLVNEASAMTQGKKSDAAWESFQSTLSAARAVLNDGNASQDAVNEAATSLKEAIDRFNASENVMFQVGHTYEVPIAFFKQGSVTEKSMAAQYFGDTALVRPQENGTFTVSFAASTQGLEYIKSLSYQGTAIAQSGNQFTLSIPAAESDTVIPISMSVTMMAQLGIGQSQVADMHLYLSQAKDLGTGQSSVAASSSNLAQTGDATTGAVTLAGGALVAGAALALTARRRMARQK